MYGECCQVMSSMEAAGNDNSLYNCSPSFNFMPTTAAMNSLNFFSPILPKEESEIVGGKSKDEVESFSGSEPNDPDGTAENPPPAKKKRYHRHTARQIQELETMFKENPHPDDKQRQRLSLELGLKPRQVKFWFQNRRTQMKAQQDKHGNVVLRAENETLKKENCRLQMALTNIICPTCEPPPDTGFHEHHIRLENARLKEELDRVCSLVAHFSTRPSPTPESPSVSAYDHHRLPLPINNCPNSEDPMASLPLIVPQVDPQFLNEYLIMEEDKSLAFDLAAASMDELVKMCHAGEPLWIPSQDPGRTGEVLNVDEYSRIFCCPKLPEGRFRTEATRHAAVVIMNGSTLVDAFMDADKWMELFPNVVSRANTIQVVHRDESRQSNDSLLLMYAEVQFPSPLVATREAHFLRYSHHNVDEGSWAIVDFPIDVLHTIYGPPNACKRRASGCVIQDMPNGYSRVTWMEHAEVEDNPVHEILNPVVTSGAAFGARRWLGVLQRQSERLASLMARNIPDLGVIPSPEARRNLMNLAQRMIRVFCINISTSYGQSWTALSNEDNDNVRITTRKATDPGQPNGLILGIVSSVWLPYGRGQVFDFLRDERRRVQKEVLSNGNSLHEVAHIANGSHPGNCISLLRVNVASNSSQMAELVLQESCSDNWGSMVVYSTINVDAVQLAMNGEDPSCIPLLPLGFIITPMANPDHPKNTMQTASSNDDGCGCLLTIGLQVLASTIPSAKVSISSINTVNQHLCTTIKQINEALGGIESN